MSFGSFLSASWSAASPPWTLSEGDYPSLLLRRNKKRSRYTRNLRTLLMRRTKNGQMSDPGGAQWQADDLLAARSEGDQCRIAKGLRDQRNPKGQSAFAKAGRDGDRREIQQVDEVGIEPEIGVEALWLGGYGCDLVIGAGGGQQ